MFFKVRARFCKNQKKILSNLFYVKYKGQTSHLMGGDHHHPLTSAGLEELPPFNNITQMISVVQILTNIHLFIVYFIFICVAIMVICKKYMWYNIFRIYLFISRSV